MMDNLRIKTETDMYRRKLLEKQEYEKRDDHVHHQKPL